MQCALLTMDYISNLEILSISALSEVARQSAVLFVPHAWMNLLKKVLQGLGTHVCPFVQGHLVLAACLGTMIVLLAAVAKCS